MIKQIGIGIAAVAGLIVVGIVAQTIGIANFSYFGAKQANAERNVMVNSTSYIQGKNQILSQYIYQFDNDKNEIDRIAIKGRIRDEVSTVDKSLLSPSVQQGLAKVGE